MTKRTRNEAGARKARRTRTLLTLALLAAAVPGTGCSPAQIQAVGGIISAALGGLGRIGPIFPPGGGGRSTGGGSTGRTGGTKPRTPASPVKDPAAPAKDQADAAKKAAEEAAKKKAAEEAAWAQKEFGENFGRAAREAGGKQPSIAEGDLLNLDPGKKVDFGKIFDTSLDPGSDPGGAFGQSGEAKEGLDGRDSGGKSRVKVSDFFST